MLGRPKDFTPITGNMASIIMRDAQRVRDVRAGKITPVRKEKKSYLSVKLDI